MITTAANRLANPSAHDVPPRLALLPVDIEQDDGAFRIRGMNTGRLLMHRSALLIGAVADLEWNQGLRDVVSVDDVLAHGGPGWSEEILSCIDGDLAPDLLVQVIVGGSTKIQAVNVCTEQEKAGSLLDGSVQTTWAAYRAHGLAWGVVTDAHLDFHRVSNAVWLCRAVERGAPFAALHAVRSSLSGTGRRETIADVLGRAALAAGVPVTTAVDAFGCLIASRQIGVDIDSGVIRSDLAPGACGERADDVLAAWMTQVHSTRFSSLGSSLNVSPARLAAPSTRSRSRRQERAGSERRDVRRWSRPDRYV